ncbi:hypothetical protein [Pseudomonas aeruginosa]|uniref:hypothetical protein n=1 Tax=Pseudomonas aeruginosa TaxID=287 RepID=UPI001D17F1EA|nr:hypothetical protein [Pseudomonas aeruginosa]
MSKDLNKATAEQAGGDERDFQAKGAQEVPSPVSKEYDRHLISLLRKGEALPGHQEEAADEIERLRDWNDHLNNTVLPNILNPNFLMLMKGGERLLDLCTKDGEFIGVSLNDMKDVFDWMVTHARIAPDQAALAQPSPAQAEQAEVVAWRYGFSGGIVSDKACLDEWKSGGEYQSLMTVAQHERIVGALRAVITQLHQHKNDYMDAGQETYRALQNEIREREAEIARLDGLVSGRTAERDAALANVDALAVQVLKLGGTISFAHHRTAQAGQVPQAWLDVQAERRRQITAEGWTPEHDDLYCAAELPRAAAAYILNGANDEAPAIWPFVAKWWKPRDARSNYVRAGALILAEIERLDRAAPGKEVGHE